MSGRSIGLAVVSFSGIRVTNQLTYIPAHINGAGKRINAKVTIPVAKNSHKGTRPDGSAGRTDYFSLTAWGKLADIMCRSCPPGKALDVVCEPRSYMGKLFNTDGTLRLDAAGQAIEIPKMSFNIIMYPVFGEESRKQVDKEIGLGLRPQNWNVQNHPDWGLWTEELKRRQAQVWDGQSREFLYARVVVPQGVQLDFSQGQTQYQQPAGAPNQTMAPSVESMVQQAVNQPQQVRVVNMTPPAAGSQFTSFVAGGGNQQAPQQQVGRWQPFIQGQPQQFVQGATAPVAPTVQGQTQQFQQAPVAPTAPIVPSQVI